MVLRVWKGHTVVEGKIKEYIYIAIEGVRIRIVVVVTAGERIANYGHDIREL